MADVAWACTRRDDFSLRAWPDGCVVLDEPAGQLRCLESIHGELMTLLLQRPSWTAAALAEELLGEPPAVEDVELVENALAEFSALQLVERIVN